MTTYVDSSVLVAVYVPERFSKAAREAVRAALQIRLHSTSRTRGSQRVRENWQFETHRFPDDVVNGYFPKSGPDRLFAQHALHDPTLRIDLGRCRRPGGTRTCASFTGESIVSAAGAGRQPRASVTARQLP